MDEAWKNHIHALNSVRESIHNRAYAQQDPLQEYKKEAFELFEYMLDGINAKFLQGLYKCIKENIEYFKESQKNNSLVDNETSQDQGELHINLTRNDPCYCKSGKKYKHCHGKIKG